MSFRLLALSLIPFLLAAPAARAATHRAIKGESRLIYRLHHPLHEVVGRSESFECTVELAGDSLRPRIHVKASVASFNSGNSNRDSHTMEILEVYKFPHVEFTGDSAAREEGGYRVFGRLSFHGVKRPVDFPVTAEQSGKRIRVRGGFMIRLSDYKVKRPSLLMIPTADSLRVEIDVAAPAED